MNIPPPFKGKTIIKFAVIAFCAFYLAIPFSAQAGFEWVPAARTIPTEAQKQKENLAPPNLTPPVHGLPVLAPEPVIQEPPITFTAPAPITEAKPLLSPAPVAQTQVITQPAPKPVMMARPIVSEPVLKVKTISRVEPPAVQEKQRYIMPDDAPEAARAINSPVVQTLTVTKTESPIQSIKTSSPPLPILAPVAPPPLLEPAMPEERLSPAPVLISPAPQIKSYAQVEGFGNDIPLALALRQVVPASYAYSFGKDVNPGYRVSWSGGKSWVQIVSDMIKPLNLQIDIKGNALKISTIQSSHPAALAPEAGSQEEELKVPAIEDSYNNLRRQNITDPGEKNSSIIQEPQIIELAPALDAEIPDQIQTMQEHASFPAAPAVSEIELEPVNLKANAQISAPQDPLAIHEAREGKSLRKTLTSWAQNDNITLIWDVAHDYDIETSLILNDTFPNAVKTVLEDGFKTAESRPTLQLLLGQSEEDKTTVLVVSENFQDAVKSMFSEGGFDIKKDKPALKMLNTLTQTKPLVLLVESES